MDENRKQNTLLYAALAYLGANLDDANEVLETHFTEEEVTALRLRVHAQSHCCAPDDQVPGYSERLTADRQVSMEEALAAFIQKFQEEAIKLDEENGCEDHTLTTSDIEDMSQQLLFLVLREFRPDLFLDYPTQAGCKYPTAFAFAEKLAKGEPWFGVRGQDLLAVPHTVGYVVMLTGAGNMAGAEQVRRLATRMHEWQAAHRDTVKLPD